MMRVWLAVFVLAAVTCCVTPCCLPNEFFLDFDITIKSLWSYNGEDFNHTNTATGNASVDIQAQKFRATVGFREPSHQIMYVHYLLDLSKTPGAAVMNLVKDDMCMERVANGKVGKEWRCVLDNKNIFTKKGSRIYDINILDIITGTVEILKDTCLPVTAEVTYTSPTPRNNEVAEVFFFGYNIAEKVHSRSDLDKPCNAPAHEHDTTHGVTILTPDQLLEQLKLMVERERNMGTTPPPQPYTTWIPEYFTTESPLESEKVIDEAGQQEGSATEQDDED